MKPYPAYKPSGIAWLGDIPAHWEVSRLKYVSHINPENLPESTPPDYLMQYLDIGNVDEINGIGSNQDIYFENAPSRARRIVRQGDTIVSTVRTYLKAVAYFENPANNQIVSTGFAVIRPKYGVYSRYLKWLILSNEFIERVVVNSEGIGYPAINPSVLAGLPVWLPPLAEQQAIAAYLDGETARLDALAARYRRLLALLDEKRRALITHAVTRGLNPAAPLKDSGIEWLGRIPEAWKIAKIKHIVDNTNGSIRPGPFGSQLLSSEMESGDIKVYNQRSVINHDVSVGENFITEQKFRELRTFEVSVGDILITSRGTIGKCLIVPENAQRGIIHPCLIRIRLDISKILREYFSYVFQESSVIQDQLFYQSNATTIEVIYSDNIKRAVLALPPITEQRNIVEYLDRETARLDDLKAKIETLLARLGEYRAALISAAVTGKMDVHRPAG